MRMGLSRRYYRKKTSGKSFVLYCVLLLITTICFATYTFLCRIHPVFKARAESYAISVGTSTINEAVNELISEKGITYSDFVKLEKANDNSITALEGNTISMNTFKTDVSNKIQTLMSENEDGYIHIPIGSLFGSEVLSGFGYKIPIKLSPTSISKVDFNEDFASVGINQVKHSIWLDIDVSMSVISSTSQISESVHTKILVAETIIVGRVPEYYADSGKMNVSLAE